MKRNLTVTLLFLLVLLIAGILQAGEYVIQKGDTLWDLSGKFLKKPENWEQLWKANSYIKDPHWIFPGNKLVIPEGGLTNVTPPAAPEVKEEKPAEKPVPAVTEEKKVAAEVKAEVKAEEKKEEAPAVVEKAKEETKTEDATLKTEQAGEVKEETPVAVSAEIKEEAGAEIVAPESFTVNQATNRINTNVSGSLTLQKEAAAPLENESVPKSKFKAQASVVAYNPADKESKTMFATGDIVVIDAGANKGLEEGATIKIYKIGKLLSERGTLDEANRTMKQEELVVKKETTMVNKIAEAKVLTVKKNSSYIEIQRSLEPVTIGDLVKFNQ